MAWFTQTATVPAMWINYRGTGKGIINRYGLRSVYLKDYRNVQRKGDRMFIHTMWIYAMENCRFDRVYCHIWSPQFSEQNGHMFDYLVWWKRGTHMASVFDKEICRNLKYEIVGAGYLLPLPGRQQWGLLLLGGCTFSGKWNPGTEKQISSGDTCGDISGVGRRPKPGVKNGNYMNADLPW